MYSIDKERIFSFLKEICEIVSPSGFEQEIRKVIINHIKDHADNIWIDAMGNIIAVKKGKEKGKLMISAHMDEIGLMIKHIDKNGFLRFAPIGGWNPQILPAQRVLIRTLNGNIVRGAIGVKPPHIMEPKEKEKVIPIDKLFIDIGVSSKEEAEKLGITVGAVAVIDRTVERLGNPDVIVGRAFDDKIGVATAVEAFKILNEPDVDVYLVITVQEEVGLKGAKTAAFSIGPDVGIAIDVTTAADVPGVSEQDQVVRLGKGPAIKIMDGKSGSGIIVHPAVRDLLIETARAENIPYQLEILIGGTTDASAIQLTKEGVPTGAISIPTRYIHSPVEIINLNDVSNAIKLLASFTMRLDKEWIEANLRTKVK